MKRSRLAMIKLLRTILLIFLVLITLVALIGMLSADNNMFFLFLVCLILGGVATAFYLYAVYLPLKRRQNDFRKYLRFQTPDALTNIETTSIEEDQALKLVHEKLTSEKDMESYEKEAEYLALQNQINPHFLYNTLEAIRSDAIIAGIPDVASIAKALSKYFRYTISATGETFTVEEELENVKNYFSIQNYRFGNRMNLEIQCSETDRHILECLIPKLTLQPLVENAIKHGLEPLVKQGSVTIDFETTNSRLIIHVQDNGVGMDQEMIDKINDSLKTGSDSAFRKDNGHRSIALGNVHTRIQLLFGADYGLHVLSQKDVGTDITVTLPLSYKKRVL